MELFGGWVIQSVLVPGAFLMIVLVDCIGAVFGLRK